MDQGLVALLTAGVGLAGVIGGAVIGGAATARGARFGAEAAMSQVHDQAVIDHEKWVRGQSLDACQAFLAAYDDYAIRASNVTRLIDGPVTPPTTLGSDLGQSFTNLRKTYFRVRLVAPPGVREAAADLRVKVEDHRDAVDRYINDFLDRGQPSPDDLRAEVERLRHELGELHGVFLDEASRGLERRLPTA